MVNHDDYHKVEQALHYLGEHYQKQPGLEEIAAHVHLSPFHFQRIFQRWAGISPKKFLQFLTLEKARQRLRHNEDLLSTALDLGLSGPGRLHDLFINLEGMTPGQYKEMGRGLELYHASFPSPFGPCVLAGTRRGLCMLSFHEEAAVHRALLREWPQARLVHDPTILAPYHQAVFGPAGARGELSLLLKGSPFRLKVWEALLHIPAGRIVSYTQLAAMVGRPDAVRAVASAVAQNPLAILIPCHRVIRGLGQMGGYRWGIPRKLALIGWEACREEVS